MKPQSLIFLSLVFLDYGFSASVGVMEDDAALEDNGRELENVHDISHFHLPASDTAAKEERPREERGRLDYRTHTRKRNFEPLTSRNFEDVYEAYALREYGDQREGRGGLQEEKFEDEKDKDKKKGAKKKGAKKKGTKKKRAKKKRAKKKRAKKKRAKKKGAKKGAKKKGAKKKGAKNDDKEGTADEMKEMKKEIAIEKIKAKQKHGDKAEEKVTNGKEIERKCHKNSECNSLFCFEGKCSKQKVGMKCLTSDDCEGGHHCSSKKCIKKHSLAENAPCSHSSDCIKGRCNVDICLQKHSQHEGKRCFGDVDCKGGRCSGRICTKAKSKMDGEHCKRSSDCKGGRCTGKICAKKNSQEDGEICSHHLDCKSGRCSQGRCLKAHSQKKNEACIQNYDCVKPLICITQQNLWFKSKKCVERKVG